MEKQINEKMTEIVYKVNDMIPVEWDDLYINFILQFDSIIVSLQS